MWCRGQRRKEPCLSFSKAALDIDLRLDIWGKGCLHRLGHHFHLIFSLSSPSTPLPSSRSVQSLFFSFLHLFVDQNHALHLRLLATFMFQSTEKTDEPGVLRNTRSASVLVVVDKDMTTCKNKVPECLLFKA